MSIFDLTVNGQMFTVDADESMPLLWVLRDLLGFTGTKFSCGMGLCGSCTVLVDDEPTRSCIRHYAASSSRLASACNVTDNSNLSRLSIAVNPHFR